MMARYRKLFLAVRAAVKGFQSGFRQSRQEAKTLSHLLEEPRYSPPPTTDFFEYVDEDETGGWVAPCQGCGEDTDIICDPSEFSLKMHYCGQSPRCCP